MGSDQFYWDANAFLGLLNDEDGKADECARVLAAAKNGTVIIVTSALTLTEVLFVKGQPKLDPAKRSIVDRFFRAPYISVRNVTRQTADLARDLVWDLNIRPKDAIHVATACLYKVPIMHTFDDALIGKSGLVLAGHQLTITKPAIIHQTDWVEENEQKPAENTTRSGNGNVTPNAQHSTESAPGED